MINTEKIAVAETIINNSNVQKKDEKTQKNTTIVFNQKKETNSVVDETFDTFVRYMEEEFNPDSVIYDKTTNTETNEYPPGLVEFPGVDINIKLKNKINENEFDIPPQSKEEKIYYNILDKVDNIVKIMSKVFGLGYDSVSFETKDMLFESLLKIFLVANGFNPNYRPPMIFY